MITSAEQLLELVELTSLTYFEYSGKRSATPPESGEQGPANVKSQVMQLVRGELISIRCRVNAETARGQYIVDLAANYSLAEPSEIAGEAIDEFINRSAMMTLWPYIRIGLQELTARIEGRSLVLGLHIPAMDSSSGNPESEDEQADSADG